MYRQSPSRNPRSKGIRIKHVLQICLLLAVCFWLIYQVKHSHDKKKEFDESDAKGLLQKASSDDFIRLGRKDLLPRLGGITSKNEKHDEPAEEEEATVEAEENKHEEEDEPEDNKIERKEDEGKEGGDDETDEHEQEKSDAEVDGEEDLVDDEKEKEIGGENETQETDSEDGHGQMEKESSVEDTDHDGDDRSTHEAREEHYKADDASSAVTHDTHIVSTENENEHMENSNEHPESTLEEQDKENNIEETSKGEDRRDLVVEGGEVAGDDHQSNVTTSETKADVLDNSENSSPPNNTVSEGFNDHLPSNSVTEVTTQNHDLPLQNVTEREPVFDHGEGVITERTSLEGSGLHTNASEGAKNSMVNVDSDHFSSNPTDSAETKDAESHPEEFPNSSINNTESSASGTITAVEASTETGNITESSSEQNDEIEAEKISDGTDEILESTITENPEEVQHDTIDMSDTSNSLEEKDVRTDLDTLPEIQTEGTNSEDVAAE